jgi:hypothetical protein
MAAAGPQWPNSESPQETAIANQALEQDRQQIVKTSDGNFVIAWADQKSGLYNIYAEKIDPWNKRFWNANNPGTGIIIAQDTTDVDRPFHNLKLIADPVSSNLGGSIIAWDEADIDNSSGGIFAKRLNMEGLVTPGWRAEGNPIDLKGASYLKALISDGKGGAYIAWIKDNENKELYLARVRASDGTIDPKWNNGLPIIIQTSVDPEAPVEMVPIDSGTVIITYAKSPYLEANKISSTGTKIWAAPVQFHNYENLSGEHHIISDNNGGIIAAYPFFNGLDYDIKSQHINTSGGLLWENSTNICNSEGDQTDIKIITDNVNPYNGAIITWRDQRGSTTEIFAQRINELGLPLWPENGIVVSDQSNTLNKKSPQIVSNGETGAIITFLSEKTGSPYNNLLAQQINGSGTLIWSAGGINISNSELYKINTEIAGDNNGGAALAWQGTNETDQNGQPVSFNIFAQFISDPESPPVNCSNISESQTQASFCAKLMLVDPILTFINTPQSFSFTNIGITGNKIERFNNYTTQEITHSDDLIGVQDTRLQGGFAVQLQAAGNFITDTNPTQEMDLGNCIPGNDNQGSACLYAVTTTSSTYTIPGTTQEIIDGVIYQPAGQTQENIVANINADGTGLGSASTYTNNGSDLKDMTIAELMNGSLPLSTGRNGKVYQYISYYLKIPGLPAAQPVPGNYALTLTFTLLESNL